MAIVRNILVRVGANINPLQQGMTRAQRTIGQFANHSQRSMATMNTNTNRMVGVTAAAATAIKAMGAAAALAFGAISVTGAKSAMEYESSVQRLNFLMGENAAGFIEWAKTQALAYNMSILEATKFGAVYGNLMTTVTNDQALNARYSAELLKASAIVASGTGRSMTDVMERIRSGLLGNTEAIEDLGINIYVNLLESTEAFRRFAGDKSWEQLDFQTQQQIRLFAILEQTANKFGNSVYQNTASGLMQFTALLKDAQLNIGQAFLPLINAVLPTLINFANGLKYVTAVFSQFMQALFGVKTKQIEVAKAVSSTAKSASGAAGAQDKLGKATKAAAAEAKRSVAGFDEINELQESMAASGASAADAIGGGDIGGGIGTEAGKSPVPDKLIPQSVLDNVEKFKAALAPVKAYISDIADMFRNFWKDIQPALQPIVDFIIKVFQPVWEGLVKIVGILFETLKGIIGGALQVIEGIIKVFAGVLTGDWKKIWEGIKDITWGVWTVIKAVVGGTLEVLKVIIGTALGGIKVIWETAWNSISKLFATVWDGMKTVTTGTWKAITAFLSDTWQWLSEMAANIFGTISGAITGAWDGIKSVTGELWMGIKNIFKEGANGAISSLEKFLNFAIDGFNKLILAWNTAKSTLGISGWTMPIEKVQLPRLAKGGIISSPTLAMVGESGKEAVVPLEDTSFVDTLAGAIGTAVLNAMQFSQGSNNATATQQAVFNLDGSQFARAIIPLINKETTRRGNMAITSA